MPRDTAPLPLSQKAARLNDRLAGADAVTVLRHALSEAGLGRVALVSSFGAESVVLLHMVSRLNRDLPVLFLNTEMLFPETLSYQRRLAESLGLSDVRVLTPDRERLFTQDPDALLHRSDPDACCALRKTQPLQAALAGFDGWITGRKRTQGGARADLPVIELDPAGARLKINPLAHWPQGAVRDYIRDHALPRHPLVKLGYRSLGCMPCTGPGCEDETDRAGRWRDTAKTECGIHLGGSGALPGAA